MFLKKGMCLMTLKEKLAVDSAICRLQDYANNPKEPVQSLPDTLISYAFLRDAYLEGFEKARELAAKEAYTAHLLRGDCNTPLANTIMGLGEEEV